MSDIAEIEKTFNECLDNVESVAKIFKYSASSDAGFRLLQLRGLFRVFHELLPFDEGDRVVIVKKINCENAWKRSEHFLGIGSIGTVTSIGLYADSGLYAYVKFDDESWIDDKGVERPIEDDRKHVFNIGINSLQKLKPQPTA